MSLDIYLSFSVPKGYTFNGIIEKYMQKKKSIFPSQLFALFVIKFYLECRSVISKTYRYLILSSYTFNYIATATVR